MRGGYELTSGGSVYSVEAGADSRRGAYLQMDFLCAAAFPQHLDYLLARCTSDYRVVYDYQPLPFEEFSDGIKLDLDAEMPDAVLRLYKGPSDVMVSDKAEIERDAALLGKPYGRRDPGIGNGYDKVSVCCRLPRQLP